MAWFSGKVSLGNFPDIAGAVNKLQESVKNIEKNIDSALRLDDKPVDSDASTTSTVEGLWPVMTFMGSGRSGGSDAESSAKTGSPQKLSTSPEKETREPAVEHGATEENDEELNKDTEHPGVAEKKPDVIPESRSAESESKPTIELVEPDGCVDDFSESDSVDNPPKTETSEVTPDSVEARAVGVEEGQVNEAMPRSDEPLSVVDTGESAVQDKAEAKESVEESSAIQEQVPTLPEVETSSGSHAEVAPAPLDSHSMSVEETWSPGPESSSLAPPSYGTAELFSESASHNDDTASVLVSETIPDQSDLNVNATVDEKQIHDGEVGNKEQQLSTGSNISDSSDTMLELEKVKKEMKMMESALLGAARQAQAKADEIAKLMNENENLKAVIEDLKKETPDAEIESLREEYHQKVTTLEKRVYTLTRERDNFKKEKDRKTDTAALLKEKDEIIMQVMAEGEALSKKQAAQEATIRKLRAQIRELEEEKKGLMTRLQVEENKVESIRKDKTETENLLQETIEKHQAELAAQKEYYTNALAEAKEAEALAEARADNEARTELESRLREAEEREHMLVQTLEELRQTLSRKEQQAAFREDMLRRDIEDLQQRYQASERRCEELITQVPDSTRPLLRQIEAMQETAARRAEAWAAVERSLNSRLQEAEAKAAAAEERERSVNERLSQTLSRLNVLEAQISCLRSEQTQLSRSLEKERHRSAEHRQEYLAAKEEADTHEGRANQLEEEIRELRRKHKEELQEISISRELLQQEIEKEKAARMELEQKVHIHPTAASDRTPIARTNSAFENGNLARKLSTASSLGSMEESFFLQASLDTSDTFSERRNPGELSPYYMKSMTPSAFESALRQKEGELASYMSRLASMESIRDSLAEELVKMTAQCEKLQVESALLPGLRAELDALRRRHSAALELMGERDEELEELRADIIDMKEMYREQVNLLVNKISSMSQTRSS